MCLNNSIAAEQEGILMLRELLSGYENGTIGLAAVLMSKNGVNAEKGLKNV